MDIREFLKEQKRMCDATDCESCSIHDICPVIDISDEFIEKVETWSALHPKPTNEDKLLEVINSAFECKETSICDIITCSFCNSLWNRERCTECSEFWKKPYEVD